MSTLQQTITGLVPFLVGVGGTWIVKAKAEAKKIDTLLTGVLTAISDFKDSIDALAKKLPAGPSGASGTSGPAVASKK